MFPPRLINAFPWSAGLGSKPLKKSSICYWGRNFLRKSSPCSPPCLFLVLWHMSSFHWTILQLLLATAGLWVHQNRVAEKKCSLEKVCISSSPSWLSLLFLCLTHSEVLVRLETIRKPNNWVFCFFFLFSQIYPMWLWQMSFSLTSAPMVKRKWSKCEL